MYFYLSIGFSRQPNCDPSGPNASERRPDPGEQPEEHYIDQSHFYSLHHLRDSPSINGSLRDRTGLEILNDAVPSVFRIPRIGAADFALHIYRLDNSRRARLGGIAVDMLPGSSTHDARTLWLS